MVRNAILKITCSVKNKSIWGDWQKLFFFLLAVVYAFYCNFWPFDKEILFYVWLNISLLLKIYNPNIRELPEVLFWVLVLSETVGHWMVGPSSSSPVSFLFIFIFLLGLPSAFFILCFSSNYISTIKSVFNCNSIVAFMLWVRDLGRAIYLGELGTGFEHRTSHTMDRMPESRDWCEKLATFICCDFIKCIMQNNS